MTNEWHVSAIAPIYNHNLANLMLYLLSALTTTYLFRASAIWPLD